MQIIILASGKSSRFFPLGSPEVHKSQIELYGKPLVVHTLRNLASLKPSEVIIVKSPQNTSIEAQIKAENFDFKIKFFDQPKPVGMANALLEIKDHLEQNFFVTSPYNFNAHTVISQMLVLSHTGLVLSSTLTETPHLYGIIKTHHGLVTEVVEKPKSAPAPILRAISIYQLTRDFILFMETMPQSEYLLETALNKYMQTNPVKVVQTNHFMPTLKYPWHLFAIKDQLYYYYKNLSGNFKKASFIAENATIEGSVIIAEGAKVFENACIKGNTYIGPNAIVGNNAVVRDSILEEDTQVGVGADIARSIFLKDSHFHGSGFIGDSIIGPGNRLAAGLITANKRFDRKTVKTMVKNKLIDTKLLSLGTITGEGVKTGIRVGTMPGVIISQYAQIPPGKIVKKNL